MGYAHFVDVLQERHFHVFFKEPAEIFFAKPHVVCDILQRNRIAEIFIYIGDHFADPGERLPVPCVYIPGCGPRRKNAGSAGQAPA